MPASSGTSATSGMNARSWNSSTAKPSRPARRGQQLALGQHGQHDGGGRHRQPGAQHRRARPGDAGARCASAARRRAARRQSCAVPRPNTARRITHSRCGRSSSPIRNSSMTTPRLATWRSASTSVTRRSPDGADRDAGHQVAEHAAEPGAARQRHRDRGGGEQGDQRCQHRRRSAWVDQAVAYSAHGDHSEVGCRSVLGVGAIVLPALPCRRWSGKSGAARMSAPPPRGSRNPLGARHRGGNRTPVNHRLRATNMV